MGDSVGSLFHIRSRDKKRALTTMAGAIAVSITVATNNPLFGRALTLAHARACSTRARSDFGSIAAPGIISAL